MILLLLGLLVSVGLAAVGTVALLMFGLDIWLGDSSTKETHAHHYRV